MAFMWKQHEVKEYFPDIGRIKYDPKAEKALAFREYNADEVILGKPMREWCRFAVCYWHTFGGSGSDPFGPAGTFINRSWNDCERNVVNMDEKDPSRCVEMVEAAKCKADAAFELFVKLGVDFYTFHDRDVIGEGSNMRETTVMFQEVVRYMKKKQSETGVKCLWGTANLFSHRRFMNGALTNPDVDAFVRAAKYVKEAMEMTVQLGGANFVFWAGRDGYQTLLNTDLRHELDQMAAFYKMVVEFKKTLSAPLQLLIEPKPCEPTKHQYDYDAATVMAFLDRYGLEDDFKLNIEPNHTTLAGHEYEHDICYAAAYNMLGSIDCNTGDPMLGWDTDQFLTDDRKATLVMKQVIEMGGLAPGGLNFDAKVRRESTDLKDIFIAHIGSMDCFARGLRRAAAMIEKNELSALVKTRYASWDSDLGRQILTQRTTLTDLSKLADASDDVKQSSGQQELYELMLSRALR
ncbi:TPA: hypothetical protein N0F65_005296 [Lagenidium giganteum]|uniref:Xylose isomerase n=1 Tax=Lagenidium giganteum TaxID=4803 RepID=A0AAV2Z1B2_9STRA|nr:TPA: hypothetical protein N0F65_005296 [Lagenidium giganteum]